MLTEDDKSRIRSEEIFRSEIRDEINNGASRFDLMKIVNSPILIWFLSTVVVGVFSLLYSNWADTKALKIANQNESLDVLEEGSFRTNQVQSIIDKVLTRGNLIIGELDNRNGTIHGSTIADYPDDAILVAVALELGGITTLAPENDTRDVMGRNKRHLPLGRAFKRPRFQYDNLLDLAKRLYLLQSGEHPPVSLLKDSLVRLEDLRKTASFDLRAINDDWYQRRRGLGKYEGVYRGDGAIYDVDVADFDHELRDLHAWIKDVSVAWSQLLATDLFLPFAPL